MKKVLLGTVALSRWLHPRLLRISLRAPTPRRRRDDRRHVRLERLLHRRQWRLGFEPQVLGQRQRRRRVRSPPKAAMTRPAAWPVVRSAIAGRPQPGCSASKRQGDWADLKGRNISLLDPARSRNNSQHRRVRPVHRSGRLRRQQRAALRQGRRGRHRRIACRGSASAPAFLVTTTGERHPLGRHGRRGPRIRLRPELVGRHRIDHLFMRQPHLHLHRHGSSNGGPSRTSASSRTSISSPCASTIAGAARSSRSTDLGLAN